MNIVEEIWSRAAPGDVYLPVLGALGWTDEEPVKNRKMRPQPPVHDQFFSPFSFNGKRAYTNLVEPLTLLFADLDEAAIPTDLPPSVAWETSLQRTQAVWFLDRGVSVGEFTQINLSLSTHLGADIMASYPNRLMRVPGSINHRSGYQGQVLIWEDREYNPETIVNYLGVLWDIPAGFIPPPIGVESLVARNRLPHEWEKAWNEIKVVDMIRLLRDRAGYGVEEIWETVWMMPAAEGFRNQEHTILWNKIVRMVEEGADQ